MDEERPIEQFLGFLKLVATLLFIILAGLALVLGLIWYLSPEQPGDMRQLTSQPVKRLPAYEPDAPTSAQEVVPLDAELADAKVEYQNAKAELEAALDARDGAPEITEQDIGVVESAIVDIVSALALNPDNEFLQRTLLSTYQRQVDLLRKSVEIAREPAALDGTAP